MKYISGILLVLFSASSYATPPLSQMQYINGNVKIQFTNFADAVNHENYKCVVVFDWGDLVQKAVKTTVDGEQMFECYYQGSLVFGETYQVYFVFENRPFRKIYRSPVYILSAT